MMDQMRALEDLKCLAGARQAGLAVAFDADQRRGQAAAGVPVDELGAGVAAQIALARRESPARGSRRNPTGTLDGAGDKAIIAAVRAAAYRRDPASVAKRAARAVGERCVSLRPAPDTMTYLTALLPVAQGVATYAALARDADTARSAGDDRPRGQVMADALVERVSGTPGGTTGVEIQLVMTDRTLLQADAEPARLPGYGTIPAATARELALTGRNGTGKSEAGPQDLDLFFRRLYTAPGTGELVAMDSKARLFPAGLQRFLQVRDDTCRTPYCAAPIRHHDHVVSWQGGGPTTAANGQGLCEACNHTKETLGWTAQPEPGTRHTVTTTTPTGHTYRSTASPLPGSAHAGPDQHRYAACRSTAEQALPPNAVHVLGRVIPPSHSWAEAWHRPQDRHSVRVPSDQHPSRQLNSSTPAGTMVPAGVELPSAVGRQEDQPRED